MDPLSLAFKATCAPLLEAETALNVWHDYLQECGAVQFMRAERQGRDPDLVRRRNLARAFCVAWQTLKPGIGYGLTTPRKRLGERDAWITRPLDPIPSHWPYSLLTREGETLICGRGASGLLCLVDRQGNERGMAIRGMRCASPKEAEEFFSGK